MTAPSASLAYDQHGNTTVLADQTLGYDVLDQHIRTTLADGTVITYLRDATGRIVQRTLHPTSGADQVLRFSFSAAGDGSSMTLDAAGAVKQLSISLPGGAQVSFAGAVESWSYPNLHGDVVVTADGDGVRIGVSAALYLDSHGGLYELDVFKGDFSALHRWPTAADD